MLGRAERRLGQPLGAPVVDVGQGIGHADVVVGAALEVIGEAELEVEIARAPVLLAGIHHQHVLAVPLLHLVGDAVERLQGVEAADPGLQALIGLHLVRAHLEHGPHRLVGEARLVEDLHLVDVVGRLPAALGAAAQLLVAVIRIGVGGERQGIELGSGAVGHRLPLLDPLRHPGKIGDPHVSELRAEQHILGPQQRLLLLGADLGHVGGELVYHGQPGFERLPGAQLGTYVHRDHHVGPHGLGHVHRHVVDGAAVGQDVPLPLHGLEGAGDGHGGLHRLGQAAMVEHEGGHRLHVGGHGAVGNGQIVEALLRRQVGGGMAQQAGHGLALEEAVRQLGLVTVDPDVGAQLVLLALLLLAQGELVTTDLVLITLVPVDGEGHALHLLRTEPHGVHARHVGTHAGAHHDVDRDALLFQHLEHPDVGRPLGAAAAQHQGYPGSVSLGATASHLGCIAGLCGRHERQSCQQKH
ncbi:hypothetical protein D3C72_570750 [compost metagenome]